MLKINEGFLFVINVIINFEISFRLWHLCVAKKRKGGSWL